MEYTSAFILFLAISNCQGIDRVEKTAVEGFKEYFYNVFQTLVYDLEEVGFCNLRMRDIDQDISIDVYGDLVEGNLKYFNGFVVSIDDATVKDITVKDSLSNTTNIANVTGSFTLDGIRFSYDVDAKLTSDTQKATGIYEMKAVEFETTIQKNLTSNEISTFIRVFGSSIPSIARIRFVPDNFLTTVFARKFSIDIPGVRESFSDWLTNVIGNLLQKVATEKISFPEIDYDTVV